MSDHHSYLLQEASSCQNSYRVKEALSSIFWADTLQGQRDGQARPGLGCHHPCPPHQGCLRRALAQDTQPSLPPCPPTPRPWLASTQLRTHCRQWLWDPVKST